VSHHSRHPLAGTLDLYAPSIDLRAVRVFLLVCDGLTFREAAASVHLAPSHATKLIQSLERTLGTPLLVRTSRSIELTPAGKAALEPARHLVEAAARLADAVSSP
jgi:DNA-binding transcriptional LysR family regulator